MENLLLLEWFLEVASWAWSGIGLEEVFGNVGINEVCPLSVMSRELERMSERHVRHTLCPSAR